MESGSTVAVIGGSGFVGRRLLELLVERGFRVRATSRDPERSRARATANVEWVRVDVHDAGSVEEAVRGANVVISSFVGDSRTQTEGTQNICDATLGAGVGRLLHLSTASVYGSSLGQIDESAPLLSEGWDYADSKIAAEGICQRAVKEGLHVTIFRPSIVYGPGSEPWVTSPCNALISRNWGDLGRFGHGTCNLVYVDDLIQALLCSLEKKPESGEVFNVCGPDTASWNEYFAKLNDALGLPALRSWSPAESLLRAGFGTLPRGGRAILRRLKSGASDVGSSTAGAGAEPLPSGRLSARQKLTTALRSTPRLQNLRGQYQRSVVFLGGKATSLLGYHPRVGVDEGVARCVSWYRSVQGATA